MRIVKIAPLAALLALAACTDEADPEESLETPGEQGGKAAGELLGGTISDEMIALDQVRSQSPPLQAEGSDASGDEDADELTDEEADSEAEGDNPSASNAAPSAAPAVAPPLQVAPPVDDSSSE